MSTKFQVLVTVEFDQAALRRTYGPVLAPPTAEVILGDLNRELRLWVGSNPYALQDPEHMTLRLAHCDGGNPGAIGPTERRALADDIGRIADELHALRRLFKAA